MPKQAEVILCSGKFWFFFLKQNLLGIYKWNEINSKILKNGGRYWRGYHGSRFDNLNHLFYWILCVFYLDKKLG